MRQRLAPIAVAVVFLGLLAFIIAGEAGFYRGGDPIEQQELRMLTEIQKFAEMKLAAPKLAPTEREKMITLLAGASARRAAIKKAQNLKAK